MAAALPNPPMSMPLSRKAPASQYQTREKGMMLALTVWIQLTDFKVHSCWQGRGHVRIHHPFSSGLAARYAGTNVSLSLPSTRVDAFNVSLAAELARNGRRSGLTFAPEGGSERVITDRERLGGGSHKDTIWGLDRERSSDHVRGYHRQICNGRRRRGCNGRCP